jgi:hypothetical protein
MIWSTPAPSIVFCLAFLTEVHLRSDFRARGAQNAGSMVVTEAGSAISAASGKRCRTRGVTARKCRILLNAHL